MHSNIEVKLNRQNFINNEFANLMDVVDCRMGNDEVESIFAINDVQTSIVITRESNTEEVGKYQFKDEVCYMNLPNIYEDEERKEEKGKAKLVLTPGTIGFCITIARKDIGDITPYLIPESLTRIVAKTLFKFFDKKDFQYIDNDILYKGKKIYGCEFYGDGEVVYCITGMLNCNYEPYANIFDNTSGMNLLKPVGGVLDDHSEITKEMVLQELYKNACEYFNSDYDALSERL